MKFVPHIGMYEIQARVRVSIVYKGFKNLMDTLLSSPCQLR